MKKLACAALVLVSACGGGGSTQPPTVTITSPSGNSNVPLGTDADKTVPISYTVTNFTVRAIGQCGSESNNCGHVHILIDGPACTPAGSAYNNTSTSVGFANALFAKCPSPQTGSHTVTLELHTDGHNAVLSAAGQPILASITFNTN